MEIKPEIAGALEGGHPVVALESTVIAHGLPAPRNLEVGRSLEEEVRRGGALPATIAVLRGEPVIGLSPPELEMIGQSAGVMKLSTRDLAIAAARRANGATTVAATSWLAHRAGISVFATGGIGGVHRGEPRDTSADLLELARTPIVVVCAGAKSILDLPATVEALESAGVVCLGWRTAEFPAFYSQRSGLPVDQEVTGAEEVAAIWRAARELGTPGAILLCVPPPMNHALPAAAVEAAISKGLDAAAEAGIRGKQLTPFLLQAIARETGGSSLETNIALLHQNCRVAAEVAVEIARS